MSLIQGQEAKLNTFAIAVDGTGVNKSWTFQKETRGLYSIFFENCNRKSEVSFDLLLKMRNPGGSQLSAGDTPLPLCFLASSGAFLVALFVWIIVMTRNRPTVFAIHYLMAMLCAVKVVSALLNALKYESIKQTGFGYGWATASHAFAMIKGIMFFGVVLLLGTGWSFLKPFLASGDKQIILTVLPLQILVNIATVVIEENPPGINGWLTWRDVLHLADILCCCAVLFPIVGSIKRLKEQALEDDKMQNSLMKLKLFREFYIIVIAYIYFTRVVVYLVRATLPCRYTWVMWVSAESATLLFFLIVGYKFRPEPNNLYLKLDQGDGPEERERVQAELENMGV